MSEPRRDRMRILLVSAITLLLIVLLSLVYYLYQQLTPKAPNPSKGETSGVTWVRSIYGFGKPADTQLKGPSSVAISPSGDIYVTDPSRARIMVFAADGAFKQLVHTGEPGQGRGVMARPESIAIDNDSNLYVADSLNQKILVFDPAARFVTEWSVDSQARGVSTAGDKVYVLGAGTVFVYDKAGKQLERWGSRGRKQGQIDAYQGIVSDGSDVFIADTFNKRVQRFTGAGTLKWAMPSVVQTGNAEQLDPMSRPSDDASGAAQVIYDLPMDITYDGAGRLVIVDAFTFELVVVDPVSGKVLGRYGEFGTDDGMFFYPASVAYDPLHDWFAVADTANNRVQLVRIPGTKGGPFTAVRRWWDNPYRWLLIPLILALFVLVYSIVGYRRAKLTEAALAAGTGAVLGETVGGDMPAPAGDES